MSGNLDRWIGCFVYFYDRNDKPIKRRSVKRRKSLFTAMSVPAARLIYEKAGLKSL